MTNYAAGASAPFRWPLIAQLAASCTLPWVPGDVKKGWARNAGLEFTHQWSHCGKVPPDFRVV
jgi:hypothetical protein